MMRKKMSRRSSKLRVSSSFLERLSASYQPEQIQVYPFHLQRLLFGGQVIIHSSGTCSFMLEGGKVGLFEF